jgi:hypothetical protein
VLHVVSEKITSGLKIIFQTEHVFSDVPEPPMDVRVLECGSRDVKLAWSEPLNGNSPILHYTVTSTQNPGELFQCLRNWNV